MSKKFSKLQKIDYNRKITTENDSEFLYQLQCAMLLSLLETGMLSPMQHRQAQECLVKQRREWAK